MIRVVLPAHLRTLAQVDREVLLNLQGPATLGSVLDALEANYPVLRGTIRDHVTLKRRPFIRFFACEQDLSHDALTVAFEDRVAGVTAVALAAPVREAGAAVAVHRRPCGDAQGVDAGCVGGGRSRDRRRRLVQGLAPRQQHRQGGAHEQRTYAGLPFVHEFRINRPAGRTVQPGIGVSTGYARNVR